MSETYTEEQIQEAVNRVAARMGTSDPSWRDIMAELRKPPIHPSCPVLYTAGCGDEGCDFYGQRTEYDTNIRVLIPEERVMAWVEKWHTGNYEPPYEHITGDIKAKIADFKRNGPGGKR